MSRIFSIIIPSYNSIDKIETTLNSIVSQDPDLYEVIIVDGKSIDGTAKVLERYQKKYPNNVRYISEPDNGIYDAMNKGILLAKGAYLYFLGMGDQLIPGVLKDLQPELKNQPEFVYGEVYNEKDHTRLMGEYDQIQLCFGNICHQAVFYHHSIFRLIGMYSLEYPLFADYEMNLRCFGNGSIIKRYVDRVIANYEGNGLSAIKTDSVFLNDKEKLISRYLGQEVLETYLFYNSYQSAPYKFWINQKFINLFRTTSEIEVGIFGTGSFSQYIYEFIQENNRKCASDIRVRCFFDNNRDRWNRKLCDQPILEPEINILKQVEKIIIASMPGRREIYDQLMNLGIDSERILLP